jgi:CBS domain-containing protein
MRVYNILNTKGHDIICVARDTTIMEALKLLSEHGIGALPVIDPAEEPIGIISERDIIRALATNNGNLAEMTVDDLMTRIVVTCKPDDAIADLVEMMKKNEFRHIPVRGKDGLIGMISMRDVATIRLLELEMENETLRELLAADAA